MAPKLEKTIGIVEKIENNLIFDVAPKFILTKEKYFAYNRVEQKLAYKSDAKESFNER